MYVYNKMDKITEYRLHLQELITIIEKRVSLESRFGYKTIRIRLAKKDFNDDKLMADIQKYFTASNCECKKDTNNYIIITIT